MVIRRAVAQPVDIARALRMRESERVRRTHASILSTRAGGGRALGAGVFDLHVCRCVVFVACVRVAFRPVGGGLIVLNDADVRGAWRRCTDGCGGRASVRGGSKCGIGVHQRRASAVPGHRHRGGPAQRNPLDQPSGDTEQGAASAVARPEPIAARHLRVAGPVCGPRRVQDLGGLLVKAPRTGTPRPIIDDPRRPQQGVLKRYKSPNRASTEAHTTARPHY